MVLFALSAGMSNSQTEFCRKCPLFLERITYGYCAHDFTIIEIEQRCTTTIYQWWDVTVNVSERVINFRAQKSMPPEDLVLTEHAQ